MGYQRIDPRTRVLRRALLIRAFLCIGLPVLLVLTAVSSIVSSANSIKPRAQNPKALPVVSDDSEFMSPEMQHKAIEYYSAKKAQESKERAAALKAGKPDPFPNSNSGWDNTENWFKHIADGNKGMESGKAR